MTSPITRNLVLYAALLQFLRNQAAQKSAYENMSRAETLMSESETLSTLLPNCAGNFEALAPDSAFFLGVDLVETSHERHGFLKLQM